MAEAEQKFAEEHKDEIDAAARWEQEQNTQVEDEYGEEDDEGDRGDDTERKPKEKPAVPVFNRDEFIKRWLEENPVIEIPSDQEEEKDTDWILTEEEEQTLVANYLKEREA